MTRDELETELSTLLIVGKVSDVMDAVDAYAAAQRAEVERWAAEHIQTRLAAERERIAQAIEAEGRNYDDTRTNSAPVVVRMLVVAAYDHSAKVARIARAES